MVPNIGSPYSHSSSCKTIQMNSSINIDHTIIEVIHMSLNVTHQLALLHDILDEQVINNMGTVAEYEQIKRLVKEMMAKNKITDEQLLQILPEVYNYGLQGVIAQSLPEHITSHLESLENWKNIIDVDGHT